MKDPACPLQNDGHWDIGLLFICSVYTLITSVDGVPFLMHDRTLRRTTDVDKVFPDRRMNEASFFNWTDLQQLNAGQWFLKVVYRGR